MFSSKMLTVLGFLAFSATMSFAGDTLHLQVGKRKLQPFSVNGFSLFSQQQFNVQPNMNSTLKKTFVVQFKNRVSENQKDTLLKQGIETKRYLPDDALIVQGTADAVLLAGTTNAEIHGISVFEPEWKISRELSSPRAHARHAQQILISTLNKGEAKAVARALKSSAEIRVLFIGSQDLVVECHLESLQKIAQLDEVEWIQKLPVLESLDFNPEFTSKLDDPNASPSGETPPPTPPELNGYESGTKIMGFEAAWARGFHGEGQTVGMADTGVDTGNLRALHQDLGGVTAGFALGMGGDSWEDPNAHGTHVCGSVIGSGRASEGHIRGGAYAASMVVEGLWSPILNNLAFDQDANRLFGTAFKAGVRIHTNSWGNPSNPGAYDSLASRVDEYLWNNPTMLVLFAAGNGGQDLNKDGRIDEGSILTPGTAKNVLTVGASENLFSGGGIQAPLGKLKGGMEKWGVAPLVTDLLSDNPDGLAAFSSRGPTSDGRIKPEIVAPGTNIVSTRSHHKDATALWGIYNAEYLYSGGTSMATPLTAGAAAVARQYLMSKRNQGDPSGALVKAAILHTAKDLYPGQYGTGPTQELPKPRPNVHEGYGRVDMDLMTNLPANTSIIDDKAGAGLNEEKSIAFTLKTAGGIRATLVYTDAPGAASSSKLLVNDLDLQITGPTKKISSLGDHTNNNEMIEMKNLQPGTYKVSVMGINIPQGKNGKQPYALIVSETH